MQRIEFCCKKCRRKLHFACSITGKDERVVLAGLEMSCNGCQRALVLKGYSEKELLQTLKKGNMIFV